MRSMSHFIWGSFYDKLGHIFQTLLFGFLVAQLTRYHATSSSDRMSLKAIVWTSFLLSLMLTIVAVLQRVMDTVEIEFLYKKYFSTKFFAIFAILNGLVMSLSQVFFSWRIYQISRKRWLQVLICLLSALQLVGSTLPGLCETSYMYSISTCDAWSVVWMASNITCDLSITLLMVWSLRRARGGATFKPTKTLLGRVLAYTMETGLITTVWMIVQLILKISLLPDSHHRDAHYLLYYPSGTLYSIWLLATLNARSSFKKDLPSYVDVTNLPAVPGEIRFRHPTVEGTEVVISIATHAVMSQDESLEETGSPSGYKQGKQGEELA